jgi:Holliday junction DNA helicase RuvA
MIAKLTGLVDERGRDHAVIDVGGVGYLLRCSTRTLASLPPVGTSVSLAVETMVREDAIELFGFAEAGERDWFRLLLTVQGVGAKVALALLSALAPDALAGAIMAGDRAMLSRAEGVGPKLAARIANELKDKVAGMGVVVPLPVAGGVPAGPPSSAAEEAVSALINLGYRRTEAAGAIAGAARQLGAGATTEGLIRASLRALSA